MNTQTTPDDFDDLPSKSQRKRDMDALQENLQGVFDKPLMPSIKARKKVAQAKEIAQLAQQLGVAL